MADKGGASANFARLQRLFLEAPVEIVSSLASVVRGSEEIDLIGKALALFLEDKKSHEVLRWSVTDGVKSSDTFQDLFRGRTLSVQILSEWCAVVARNYMKLVLQPILRKIIGFKKPLEADPRVMMANLDDNKAKLRELVEEIKKTIVEAIDKFPASFKRLIAFAAKEIDSTFKAERQRVLAVFLFSRVIIPPLLNPLQYSLLKAEQWTTDAARTGILLSKILSNVSSGTEFDTHDPLVSFNDIITGSQPTIRGFIDELINTSKDSDKGEAYTIPPDVSANSFLCIHYVLYWAKDAIVAYRNQDSVKASTTHASARQFFDLISLLEDIELAEGKPDSIDLPMLDLNGPSKKAARALPPLSKKETTTDKRSAFVRQQSEKWNKKLQQDALRQKQEREAHDKLQRQKAANSSKASQHLDSSASASTTTVSEDPDSPLRSTSPKKAATIRGGPPSPTKRVPLPGLGDSSELFNSKGSNKESGEMSDSRASSKEESTPTEDPAPNVIAIDHVGEDASSKRPRRKLAPSASMSPAVSDSVGRARSASARVVNSKTIVSPSKTAAALNKSPSAEEVPNDQKRHAKTEPSSRVGSSALRAAPEAVDTGSESDASSNSKKSRKTSAKKVSTSKTSSAPPTPASKSSKSKSAVDASTSESEGEPRTRERRNAAVDERAPLLDVPLMTHSASTPALASASPAPAPQALSSGKNSDAMVATIRNLGMENAAMLKTNEELKLRIAALEADAATANQRVEEAARRNDEFSTKLVKSILARQQQEHRVRRAHAKLTWTFNPSLDDNIFAFSKATPEERKEFLLKAIHRGEIPTPRSRTSPLSRPRLRRQMSLSESDSKDLAGSSGSSGRRGSDKRKKKKKPSLGGRDGSPTSSSAAAPSSADNNTATPTKGSRRTPRSGSDLEPVSEAGESESEDLTMRRRISGHDSDTESPRSRSASTRRLPSNGGSGPLANPKLLQAD